mgnify:CR=1 FL=1
MAQGMHYPSTDSCCCFFNLEKFFNPPPPLKKIEYIPNMFEIEKYEINYILNQHGVLFEIINKKREREREKHYLRPLIFYYSSFV